MPVDGTKRPKMAMIIKLANSKGTITATIVATKTEAIKVESKTKIITTTVASNQTRGKIGSLISTKAGTISRLSSVSSLKQTATAPTRRGALSPTVTTSSAPAPNKLSKLDK